MEISEIIYIVVIAVLAFMVVVGVSIYFRGRIFLRCWCGLLHWCVRMKNCFNNPSKRYSESLPANELDDNIRCWAQDIYDLPTLEPGEIETMIGGCINEVQTEIHLRGGFARVYKSYHALHGHVALKIMKNVADDTQVFKAEICALLLLRHDAIVAVKAMCLSPMAIVLEWMEGGSLQGAIEAKSLTELQSVLTILKDVAKGLEYIHSRHMVHRDIKPHNILLSPDRKTAKIADFGLAKIAKPKADEKLASAHFSTGPAMGTEAYTDPAYKKSKKPSRHHDVYSFGLTIMVCLAKGSDVSTLKEKLLACDQNDPNRLRDMLHKNFRQGTGRACSVAVKLLRLARQCIDPDMHKRPVTRGTEFPGALFLPSQLTQLLHELTNDGDPVYDATGLNTEHLARMPERHRQALTQQLQCHWELVENCRMFSLDGVHDRFGNVVGFDMKGKQKDHYKYYGSTIIYAVECEVLRRSSDLQEHIDCNYKGNAVKHRLCLYLNRGMSVLDSTTALENDKELAREREADLKLYKSQKAKLRRYSDETREAKKAILEKEWNDWKQKDKGKYEIPIEDVVNMVDHHRMLVRDLLKEVERAEWTLSNSNMKRLTKFSKAIELVQTLMQPQGKQPAKLRPDFISVERISDLEKICEKGNEAKHKMNSMNEEEGKQLRKLSKTRGGEKGLISANASSPT